MPLLSKVFSHLRGWIGEIRRRLSSPAIPLYSFFVVSHLPERPCSKFRRMTYTIPPTIPFFNSSINTHLSHQFHIWRSSLPPYKSTIVCLLFWLGCKLVVLSVFTLPKYSYVRISLSRSSGCVY